MAYLVCVGVLCTFFSSSLFLCGLSCVCLCVCVSVCVWEFYLFLQLSKLVAGLLCGQGAVQSRQLYTEKRRGEKREEGREWERMSGEREEKEWRGRDEKWEREREDGEWERLRPELRRWQCDWDSCSCFCTSAISLSRAFNSLPSTSGN